MGNIYILKIGGSVATEKSQEKLFLKRSLLKKIAKSFKKWKEENPDIRLILIHGAGGPGHHLAKKYGLAAGTGSNPEKIRGSLLSRAANQNLDLEIFNIFLRAGLRAVPIHTGSVIVQKDKKISSFNTAGIEHAFRNKCIPMLYGEMVFDEKLGMSICSGDASAAFLAKRFKAKKVFFATDTDGLFDKDPHLHKNAKLIKKISLKDILSSDNILLGKSHNKDATDGLRGKIMSFKNFFSVPSLEEIIIFNGTRSGNYKKILDGNRSSSTQIFLK